MGVPSKPTFFKFILDPDVQATGLRIPKKFMREHGKNLSNQVFLKVPDGAIWQVEMTTNSQNGEHWLNKGWREFAVHYSIVYTSCLLFKYESNSTFLVIIFDSSASEIEYPTSGIDIEREDEELNQNGGSYTDTETNTGVNVAVSADTEEDSEDHGDDKSDFRIKRKREASENEMGNALRLAKAFKSGNPFFLVRMQPSYVSGKSGVVIRPSFVQRNMNKRHNNVILQVISKGRTWKAKYMVYAYNAMLSTAVWKKFVEDNSLTIGDVCVFELIDGVENLFTVHVFRAMDEQNVGPDLPNQKMKACHAHTVDSTSYTTDEDAQEEDDKNFWIERKQDASENEKANAHQLAKAYTSDNPFFMVRMQPSYVRNKFRLTVQLSFVRRHLNMKCSTCSLHVTSKGRTWLVKYCVYPSSVKLTAGWKAFAQDNSLTIGDVCVFELIDNVKNLLKVHIFKAMQNNSGDQNSGFSESLLNPRTISCQ